MKSKKGAIKGLSIAILVLGILCCLGAIGIIVIMASLSSAPNLTDTLAQSLITTDPSMSYTDAQDVSSIVLTLYKFAGVWSLISGAVAIVCAVFGMRVAEGSAECRQHGKVAFVLAVICAVIAFMSFRIVSVVLCVVLAVFINRERKLDMNKRVGVGENK